MSKWSEVAVGDAIVFDEVRADHYGPPVRGFKPQTSPTVVDGTCIIVSIDRHPVFARDGYTQFVSMSLRLFSTSGRDFQFAALDCERIRGTLTKYVPPCKSED